MALPLTTIPDDVLRARLWRAAHDRMDATAPQQRAVAGQSCLDIIGELQRRGAPLWSAPQSACECGCTTTDEREHRAARVAPTTGGARFGGPVWAAS